VSVGVLIAVVKRMRLCSVATLCAALLVGCASSEQRPVASAPAIAKPAAGGVEVRHMYLFAPGKLPVRIVTSGTSSAEEVSAEPPTRR
jgi:hypothetical protein